MFIPLIPLVLRNPRKGRLLECRGDVCPWTAARLAEWAIDWYYWRGRLTRSTRENTDLRRPLASLQVRKTPIRLSAKNIPITDSQGNDNFQAIKGIGPVFAKRLNDAGVLTFEHLSRLKSRQLEEIPGSLYKRFFAKEETILA